jgi:hypothetical protein
VNLKEGHTHKKPTYLTKAWALSVDFINPKLLIKGI